MFTVDGSSSTLKRTFLSEALLMAVCMSDGDRSPLCIYAQCELYNHVMSFSMLFVHTVILLLSDSCIGSFLP